MAGGIVVGLFLAGCSSAGVDDRSTAILVDARSDRGRAGSLQATTATAATNDNPSTTDTASTTLTESATLTASTSEAGTTENPPAPTVARPPWLGRRPLPTTPDGLVVAPQSTPAALRDRRFATVDSLPAPADDRFDFRIASVPPEVLARSTWVDGCPVPVAGLRYLTVSFRGFDGRSHTGELIVNAEWADDIVAVFGRLHEAHFPIEEMRVVSMADLDAEPTGDGNNTTGFVCRPVTGGRTFSQHAHGLAIDINPFLNPYLRDDLLLPELSSSYLDRTTDRPGTIHPGDVVVEAFAEIGWGWGGDWRSLKDYQHFSRNNR